jgi:hypothetical protein
MSFFPARVVDADGEDESGCWDRACASVCALPRTAARGGGGGQRVLRFGSSISNCGLHLSTISLEVEAFSSEKLTPAADVSAFASLLVEIAIGASGGSGVSAAVPEFVSRQIEYWRSLVDIDIVDRLKAHDFEIMAGVDCDEVSTFVTLVELAEQLDKLG